MSLYLLLDILAVSVPLLLSFERHLKFYRRWKILFPAISIVMVPFLAWDILFTHYGYWGFNPDYLIGITILNLPLEEVLFFVVVPYASLFAYFSITTHFPGYRIRESIARWLAITGLVAGLLTGLLNISRPYTWVNFLFFALVNAVVLRYRPKLFTFFIPIFPVLLLPFFVMNGILTGTGIADEIVWYSEKAITGIRLLSIPIEDIFFAYSLILGVLFTMKMTESPGGEIQGLTDHNQTKTR